MPFDKRMWAEDIQGSKAHAKMLAHVGVISQEDADAIRAGLDEVGADIAAGKVEISSELVSEPASTDNVTVNMVK